MTGFDPTPPTTVGAVMGADDDDAFAAKLEQARAMARARASANLDRHCGRAGCGCKHETCDHGWIDREDPHAGTRPCADCRPGLYDAVTLAVDPEDRRHRLATYRAQPDLLTPAPGWT